MSLSGTDTQGWFTTLPNSEAHQCSHGRWAKVKRRRAGVCCLILACARAVFAATAPPVLPFDDVDWSARVERKPATGLRMGRIMVNFEKTPLREVMREAGGAIAEQGDGAGRGFWLCYTIVDAAGSQRLWLTSSAEMDGPDHAISGVMAQRVAQGPTEDCPSLPASSLPVSLSSGVWLGTTESRLIATFGVKPGINGNWRGYLYAGKRRGRCEPGGLDVVNSMEWQATGGVVNLISAGQGTTC